jgi:hypothetical protein
LPARALGSPGSRTARRKASNRPSGEYLGAVSRQPKVSCAGGMSSSIGTSTNCDV